MLYARSVARDRGEQGALALGAGFTNTVTLGYPVINAVFGPAGLALQVLFAQFMYLIPIVSVSTTIAAHYGNGSRPRTWQGIARQIINVPLIFAIIAVAIRVAGFDIVPYVERPTDWVVFLMGPVGFLELGLALPLDRISHDFHDLWRGAGPIVLNLTSHALTAALIGDRLEQAADMPPCSLRRLAAEQLALLRARPPAQTDRG